MYNRHIDFKTITAKLYIIVVEEIKFLHYYCEFVLDLESPMVEYIPLTSLRSLRVCLYRKVLIDRMKFHFIPCSIMRRAGGGVNFKMYAVVGSNTAATFFSAIAFIPSSLTSSK